MADGWIRAGQYRHILVVGAEVQSTGAGRQHPGRNTAVIFADGAGAAVLGPREDGERGILAFDLHSDGQPRREALGGCPGSMYHPRVSAEQIEAGRQFLEMDGKEVFRHAVARMPESVRAVLIAGRARTPADSSCCWPTRPISGSPR